MWWMSVKSDESERRAATGEIAPAPLAAQPRTLVRTDSVEGVLRDVTVRYSGKLQAWETYSLGFEIGGRVAALGENAEGVPLDDGDRVERGQLLARLDDRTLRARLAEAVANFELASSDAERSRRARDAITEADYENDLTRRAQALAAQQVAEKNLEDSVLTSPVAGVIARREIEAGETVGANTIVFELVEADRLRLVVNVPEARVRELELRRRRVAEARASGESGADPESAVFRALVTLEGKNLLGQAWPTIDAEVYRIAERADPVSGLFEVEIEIDNRDRLLRPGMVATADVVTDRIRAFAVPEQAVLFRADQTYLYTIDRERAPMPLMFWQVGETDLLRARRVELPDWIDQGEIVLIPERGLDLATVVTRGQERLRDGQIVRLADGPPEDASVSRVGAGSPR